MNDKPIRILLIEDNEGDARLIRRVLLNANETRSAGPALSLEHADRLSSGLTRLAQESFDVVLLDLSLPDSQGLDTVVRAHAQAATVPIVVLTGLDDEELAMQAMRSGAQDYLLKDQLNGQLFSRAIRYAIERKQTETEIRKLNAELERRVAQRTTQLEAANRDLQKQIVERQQAQEELRQAHEKLSRWVNELEQHNRELSLLSEMGDLLQTCRGTEEAYTIVPLSAQQLFPADSGALFVFNASRTLVDAVAVWGEALLSESVFKPNDCWALRRGQMHVVKDQRSGLLCRHLRLSGQESLSYLCVPMMAEGEALGMLYLQSTPAAGQEPGQPEEGSDRLAASKQRLAMTVAEHIALALANLKLREALRK